MFEFNTVLLILCVQTSFVVAITVIVVSRIIDGISLPWLPQYCLVEYAHILSCVQYHIKLVLITRLASCGDSVSSSALVDLCIRSCGT